MTECPDIEVTIEYESDSGIPIEQLQEAAHRTIVRFASIKNGGLTIVITSDEAVRVLNQRYRGVDSATDVLSFPAAPLPESLEDGHYYGDLVIAHPYTSRQASQLGHALDESLCLLVVHGTLHLLGFDHDRPETRAEMWAAQETILRELGIDPTIVPQLEAPSTRNNASDADSNVH